MKLRKVLTDGKTGQGSEGWEKQELPRKKCNNTMEFDCFYVVRGSSDKQDNRLVNVATV